MLHFASGRTIFNLFVIICYYYIIVCIAVLFNYGTIVCVHCSKSLMNTTVQYVAFAFTINNHCLCPVEMISKSKYVFLFTINQANSSNHWNDIFWINWNYNNFGGIFFSGLFFSSGITKNVVASLRCSVI